MMTIVSVLVFMLVQGRAVCDEVYPISLLEGFFVNQSEWHARDHTETQVKSIRPRPPQVSNIDCSRSISQAGAVDWITKCIVDEYKFEANENENEWISQPDFKKALGTSEFERRAGEVRKFFIQYNHWERTKKIFKKNELLMITAARYLLVTSILYTRSSFPKLTPCSRNQDRKYVIPLDGVCYPAPYGSASYKSDYDVGLIGPKSGSLTESFNIYFQSKFRKPSELVFDTNVYAFTLEFAMPSMFINLPWAFKTQVPKKEEKDSFKMQELASAYYKVFKYNSNFFGKLANGAWIEMKDPGKRQLLKEWIKIYKQMDIELGMRSASFGNNPQLLREAHNKEYQGIVKSMSVALPTPYHPKFLALLSKALIYAAEAYHTRGAIRHVVGAIQINWLDESKLSLSANDLWVSMIENWGETNKEYNHCGNENLLKCFMKMSKYMWRVLDAMTLLRERLPEELKKVNLRPCDPQFIMKMWLRYKKEERTVFTDDDVEIIRVFLKEFGCHEAKFQDLRRYAFSQSCLEKLNDKVNAYNEILAYLFSENPGKLLRK